MIDFFIPFILYDRGFSLPVVSVYIMLNYLIFFLLNYPLLKLVQRITFKWSLVLSSLLNCITYTYLLIFPLSLYSLYLIALLSSVGIYLYYATRHDYALRVFNSNQMNKEVGETVVFTQLAVVPSAFIVSFLLEHLNKILLLFITISLYVLSVIPLFRIKIGRHEKNIELTKLFYQLPKEKIYFYSISQFRVVARILFPLYLFIYIKQDYEFIGLINAFIMIAGILFISFFSKRMLIKKRNYFAIAGVASSILYVLKLNTFEPLYLLIVSLIEGLFDRMYDTAYGSTLYLNGNQTKEVSYIGMIEGMQNIVRVIIMMFFILFVKDLSCFLYICSFVILFSGFFKYSKIS